MNFSYRLEVSSENEVVVELSQRDGRMYGGLTFPYQEVNIPLALFIVRSETGNLPKSYSKKDVVAISALERRQAISLIFKAEKSVYFIVPW